MAAAELKDQVEHNYAVHSIEKSFGRRRVLRKLSLTLTPHSITLLLGVNGSGKSTFLSVASGRTRPDKGTISFPFSAPGSRPPFRHIGYVAHDPMMNLNLTITENLDILAKLREEPLLDSTLKSWGLIQDSNRPLGKLSRGQQVRTALANAIRPSAKFLFLDEPTSVLDDAGTALLAQALHNHRCAGGIALIATHDLARLRDTADRVVILHQGSVATDTDNLPGELSERIELAIAEYHNLSQ